MLQYWDQTHFCRESYVPQRHGRSAVQQIGDLAYGPTLIVVSLAGAEDCSSAHLAKARASARATFLAFVSHRRTGAGTPKNPNFENPDLDQISRKETSLIDQLPQPSTTHFNRDNYRQIGRLSPLDSPRPAPNINSSTAIDFSHASRRFV